MLGFYGRDIVSFILGIPQGSNWSPRPAGISSHFANRLSSLTLAMRRYPRARTARFIDCLKNLLVPRAELKIRKTVLVSPDSLNQLVHLEYLHVKVAQSAAGEITATEG